MEGRVQEGRVQRREGGGKGPVAGRVPSLGPVGQGSSHGGWGLVGLSVQWCAFGLGVRLSQVGVGPRASQRHTRTARGQDPVGCRCLLRLGPSGLEAAVRHDG